MERPRRQTYTLDMYLKKMKDQDIRSDQDVQRLSDQWDKNMVNELISTVLNGGYVPPIILGQEPNSQIWVIDGLQRSTALTMFRYNSYRITTSIEDPVISYRAKLRDVEGNIKYDGNGDVVWEDRTFDLTRKTYDKLPEELQKKFDEYQIETVIHEGYDMKEISKLVRRYSNHKAMNVSQKAFTFVDNYARRIREMLKRKFFIECTGYTKNERKNGTLERIVMESVMCMFHLENWKRTGQLGAYINEHASMEQFDVLDNLTERLETILTEELYGLFTSRDSFLWFTLFYRFTQSGCEDGRFADFIAYFKEMTDGKDMNEFYGIDKSSSTKDKNVVLKKLNKLETMMCDFLGIVKIRLDDKASGILEFIHEQVDSSVTREDVEQYAEVLETLMRSTGQSKLWEDGNVLSLTAIVAWSFVNDVDLDNWIVDYCSRNETYNSDQMENFKQMYNDLEQYIKQMEAA
ncbi:DUF262 domain-containing protein [bacterium C-53]|nr:DUF262 domain-containing protein [Lachnospiraceae bacterium]NBI05053.1 DUF262 domain-containing protein [Lachnospiraceae bacterium]RKJ07065.1 DUF262 domain-containing protein [bacterium C-53]